MSNQNTDANSNDPRLTEEEYEQADAEDQIKADIELGYIGQVTKRDDVELVFNMKAGSDNRDAYRTNADTRLQIRIYKIPSKDEGVKFLYRVDGPTTITHRSISDSKPKHDVIVEDAEDFVTHAFNNGDALEDTYEILQAGNDDYGNWSILADYVEEGLADLVSSE